MFIFGISYAIASLSCTLPIFLSLLATTFTQTTFFAGFAAFIAYGVGMSLVLIGITVALALGKDTLVRKLRGMAREFQHQFEEAARDTGLDDVKQGISSVKEFSPGNQIKEAFNSITDEVEDVKAQVENPATPDTTTTPDIPEEAPKPAAAKKPATAKKSTPAKKPAATKKPAAKKTAGTSKTTKKPAAPSASEEKAT